MDGDSSEDDYCFTTANEYIGGLAHLAFRKSEGCAFLRFRRLRP